jgi:hypothetical protein
MEATTALDRRNMIRSHLAIAPRPKIDDEAIEQLQVILHRAKELGDDALLLQVIQQATGALAELHAQRARAAQ